MNYSVILFTLSECIHCNLLKKKLDSLGIKYTDIDILKNRQQWSIVLELTKKDVIPTVYIRDDSTDNGTIYIPGEDFSDEDEITEIIKSYLI